MKVAPYDPNSLAYLPATFGKPNDICLRDRSNNLLYSQPTSPSTIPTLSSSPQQKHELVISPDRIGISSHRFLAHRVAALDCEMVGVGPGGRISVLARVSVVDYYGRKIFDCFVRVEERVTDYRTHVSGVTEQDLSGPNAMDFGWVRKTVKQLLKNKIIVGHGLENDLRALKIEHDHHWYNIRDSATQYQPYMRVDRFGQLRPRRLRDLAWYFLGVVIQEKGKPHDSLEDARAAVALYRHAQSNWDYEMDCKRRSALAPISKRRLF